MASHTLLKISKSFGPMVSSRIKLNRRRKKISKDHESRSMISRKEISSGTLYIIVVLYMGGSANWDLPGAE